MEGRRKEADIILCEALKGVELWKFVWKEVCVDTLFNLRASVLFDFVLQ